MIAAETNARRITASPFPRQAHISIGAELRRASGTRPPKPCVAGGASEVHDAVPSDVALSASDPSPVLLQPVHDDRLVRPFALQGGAAAWRDPRQLGHRV